MNTITKKHYELLGIPDIIENSFNIWISKDSEIELIAKEFNIYELLIKKNEVSSNNFLFAKCNNGQTLLIFAYFYDYPNPIDNGFVLYGVPNFNETSIPNKLLEYLSTSGLNLDSPFVQEQIKNYKSNQN